MKWISIEYKKYCPKCGNDGTSMLQFNDGIKSSSSVKCSKCGKTYDISTTFPADSFIASLVDLKDPRIEKITRFEK